MKKLLIIIYFLFIFSCFTIFCESLSNIYGKVIDDETKESIPNICVSLFFYNAIGGPIDSIHTDQNGEFYFKNIPVDIVNTLIDKDLIRLVKSIRAFSD